MNKFIAKCLAFIAVAAFSCTSNADTFDMSNPYKLANEVSVSTVKVIKEHSNDLSDPAVAISIIKENLMPYIDIKYASYKVIGPSLKNTTPDERDRFTAAFEQYMQRNFASVLSKYTTQTIVPADEKPVAATDSLVSVKLLISEKGKKDLELILKMRKNSKTGQWKAFDLIGENISMLDAKISEISPIIKSSGIDAAIAQLNSATK